MKKCEEIENNLPLYLDDLLSGVDKQAVEEHLDSCLRCSKALIELTKMKSLVNDLGQVEPPPWFKQKIMARVREEAEKKSFAQKWFYPLRIKIPVQIMATIVIAVLAVYIYRSGDEQIKTVLPPQMSMPVMEVDKNPLSGQITKQTDADKIVVEENIAAPSNMRNEKMITQGLSAGGGVTKTKELEKAMTHENVRAEGAGMAKIGKDDAAVDIKESNYASLPERKAQLAKSMPPSVVGFIAKEDGDALGASMKHSKALAKQSSMSKAVISLHTANINTAVEEVEKLLNKYEAGKVVKQTPDGKVLLTTEIKAKKIKDFVAQLKTFGQVEERNIPAESVEGNMPVVIEIVSD